MLEIDKTSLLVTTDTDILMSDLDKGLGREGYWTNYYGVPDNGVLLADVLNERIPNLYGETYGGIEDLCVQISLARADGHILENVLAPRSAAGPGFKKMAIGSEELWGIPIQATLKIFHKPDFRELALVVFPSSRRLQNFQNALIKYQVPLPLVCPFSKIMATHFLKKIRPGEAVLGLTLWGERRKLQDGLNFLQELAAKKDGTWFRVEGGKLESKFWKTLHHEAIRHFQKKIQMKTKEIHVSHRKLMKRIKEIP